MQKTQKNAKKAIFFCKESKRTQITQHSFAKERKRTQNVAFFWKERMPIPNPHSFFHYIFVDREISLDLCSVVSNSNIETTNLKIYIAKRTLSSFLTLKKKAPFFYVLFFARFFIFVWLMKPKRVQRSFAVFYKKNIKELCILL